MKTLVQKELREQLKLAVLGLIIFGILLLVSWRSYSALIGSTSFNMSAAAYWERLQPLISSEFLISCGWFFAGLGIVLGFLQVYPERHRDLWAFLLHRPMTRTQIFLAKIIAGLAIYLVVAGIPLFVFVIWVRIPGHVAAPFEWAMILPVSGLFLAGIVFYFAGMLVALRQARWYATRALGLGVALVACLAAWMIPVWEFWKTLLVILPAGAILAISVWGAFRSDGHYEGQPSLGKAALTLSITTGALIAVTAGVVFIVQLWADDEIVWSRYVMTKDGAIYKISEQTRKPGQIVDLNGTPLQDPKTGRPVEVPEFNRKLAKVNHLTVRSPAKEAKNTSRTFFSFWRHTPDALWYFSQKHGRLLGYDLLTRRFLGSLGPKGFSQTLSAGGNRFSLAAPDNGSIPSHVVATATAAFEADLENRSARPLFSTTADDPIEAVKDIMANGYDWIYTAVVTRRFVHLLNPQGQLIWKEPYDRIGSDYTQILVSFLEPAGQFALWIAPSGSDKFPPTQIRWIAAGRVTRSVELPTLGWSNRDNHIAQKVMSAPMPPLVLATLHLTTEGGDKSPFPWEFVLISLAVAAGICVPIGWRVGRKYQFSPASQLRWALFHLVCGFPGLLAFFSVHEWPAREVCSGCKKLRVVNREECEHCGAAFAPPPKTGIEIFETLGNERMEPLKG